MAKLARYVHLVDEDGSPHAFGPEDTVPAWAKKLITNKSAWADSDGDEGSESGSTGDGALDYSGPEWSKKALEAEVQRRNAERADEDVIVVEAPGNKDDLIAALVADDAAASGD